MTPDKIPADHDIDHAIDTGADEPIDTRLEKAVREFARGLMGPGAAEMDALKRRLLRSYDSCRELKDKNARLRALLRDAGEVLDHFSHTPFCSSFVDFEERCDCMRTFAQAVLARIREELEADA